MNDLFLLVGVFFVIQIGIFFLSRRLKRKQKESSVIDKYDIKTPHDAWKLMGDHSIPEEDRKKIEDLYHGK